MYGCRACMYGWMRACMYGCVHGYMYGCMIVMRGWMEDGWMGGCSACMCHQSRRAILNEIESCDCVFFWFCLFPCFGNSVPLTARVQAFLI
jgi:hypothetical protein